LYLHPILPPPLNGKSFSEPIFPALFLASEQKIAVSCEQIV
jgi:hypothetical protein